MKLSRIVLLAAIAGVPLALNATQLNLVTIDTSSLPASTTGYIDWSFNGGGSPTDNAAATLTKFAGPSVGATANSQSTTGSLPGPLSISNSNGDYEVAVTFAQTISFYLAFSGAAVDNPSGSGSGSTFSMTLLNATQDGAYLTSDVNDGYILQFNINNTGQVTPVTYTNTNGGPSVVSIQAVPEPAAFYLSGAGFLAALMIRRIANRA
jgi:hypothetical protein